MLLIGTDCSGIEAPIEALQQLGISFLHKWSCEIDKYARQSILANYHPEILYDDITKRDHSQLPDVDCFIAGFPCQSFSLMGKKLGSKDPRSNIMMHCIDVIKKKRPPVFILENVKNFKYIEKGKPFDFLLNELCSIPLYAGGEHDTVDSNNESLYSIHYDIYNTKDYGIPQNRERIYIVGIDKKIQTAPFQKPEKTPMRPLKDFITDWNVSDSKLTNSNIIKNLKKVNSKTKELAIVTGDNFYFPLLNCSPTLTRHCSQFYVNTLKRRISCTEALLLQGFRKTFSQVVSNSQLYKQVGNSMSVNVLKAIFKSILSCTFLKDF